MDRVHQTVGHESDPTPRILATRHLETNTSDFLSSIDLARCSRAPLLAAFFSRLAIVSQGGRGARDPPSLRSSAAALLLPRENLVPSSLNEK
ncbi:hypothetical protein ABZP36_019705, partial [Zizania latifolia]